MKSAFALLVGILLTLNVAHAVRGASSSLEYREKVAELANRARRAKGKSGGDSEKPLKVEDFQGLYKAVDPEDGSIQTLEVLCIGFDEGECGFILVDTAFGLCDGLPGTGLSISDSAEDIEMLIFCGGTERDGGPDAEIDFSFFEADLPKKISDGKVIKRRTGFTYWPIQK